MRVKIGEKNRIPKRRKSDEKIEQIDKKEAVKELSLDLPFHKYTESEFFHILAFS